MTNPSLLANSTDCSTDFSLQGSIRGLSWSPRGDFLLAYLQSGHLAILDGLGARQSEWKAHEKGLLKASWSRDGFLVASSSTDGLCKIWNAVDGQLVAELPHHEGWVAHVEWSPWSDLLMTGCAKKIRLWSQSGGLVEELNSHQFPITDMSWHPTQRDLFSSCAGDGVRAWRLGEPDPVHRINAREYPERLCFNRRGSILAYGCSDSSVQVWTLGSGIAFKIAGRTGSNLKGLDWSWGGQWLAFCGDFEAFIWQFNDNAPHGSQPSPLHGCFGRLTKLTFHPYEHLLACGDEDGTVHVWRTDSKERAMPVAISHASAAVADLAWNPFSKKLAVGYKNGSIRIWDGSFRANL